MNIAINVGRVWVIARNVFQEIFRERILYVTAVFAIGYALAVMVLSEVSAGNQAKISLDVGMGAIDLVGLIIVAFVGSSLINKEIEKRTVLVMLAKPISRGEFIIGKHLGLAGVLTVLVALMTLVFFVINSFNGFEYPLGALSLASLFVALELCLLAAAAVLLGVMTSSLIATLLTIALYFMGHFSQNLVALSQTMESNAIRNLMQSIYLILPDLSRLNLKNDAVYGILQEPSALAINAIYGIIYTVLLLAIATWLFARRNF